jgi:cell division protein FtsI (penicillin-binding protein 3)
LRQTRSTPGGTRRGSPQLRLRVGFVVIAMSLSVFGARLVQLQGLDPNSYAEMAAAEGLVEVDLPAERGDILDRNGKPFADSVAGLMVVADPEMTASQAPELAKFLYRRLHVDYASTLAKLREQGSRFEYIARRVPSTLATQVIEAAEKAGYEGLDTRRDPLRDYPAGDVGANVIGTMGTDEALAGLERTFDKQLSGTDGSAKYEVGGGNRIPLGENTSTAPVDGDDLHTTLDLDLQWYAQRVLDQAVESSRAESGFVVVMDSRTGELLALADNPTFDANAPTDSPQANLGSRAMQDVYEPGSVEKVLTMSSLIDLGLVSPRTKLEVPSELSDGGAHTIHDWFPHGMIKLTLAGVIAKSSNIGTVLASKRFEDGQLRSYLE